MKNILSVALSLLIALAFSACSESSSSGPDNSVDDAKKATCIIAHNDENEFKIVVAKPDSGTMTSSMTYQEGLLTLSNVIVFEPGTSSSDFEEECAEVKADSSDYTSCGFLFNATCEDNVVSMEAKALVTSNPLVSDDVKAPLIEMCEKVQKIETIPDDDSEE